MNILLLTLRGVQVGLILLKLDKVYLQFCQPLLLLGAAGNHSPQAADSIILESVFAEEGPRFLVTARTKEFKQDAETQPLSSGGAV